LSRENMSRRRFHVLRGLTGILLPFRPFLPLIVTCAAIALPASLLHQRSRAHALTDEPDRGLVGGVTSPPERNDLEVLNVRLEPAPAIGTSPSFNVRFDLRNASSFTLTDIAVEISIVSTNQGKDTQAGPKPLAGPFLIKGRIKVTPGSLMSYEMRLRNLSLQCGCIAKVAVVSARVVPDPGNLAETAPYVRELVSERILHLDQELIRIQLPAIKERSHVVVVHDEQIGHRPERPPQARVDADGITLGVVLDITRNREIG
jgi:hypothetical protein